MIEYLFLIWLCYVPHMKHIFSFESFISTLPLLSLLIKIHLIQCLIKMPASISFTNFPKILAPTTMKMKYRTGITSVPMWIPPKYVPKDTRKSIIKATVPMAIITAFRMYPISPALTILLLTFAHPTRPMIVRIKKTTSMIIAHNLQVTQLVVKIDMSPTVSKINEIENQVILAILYEKKKMVRILAQLKEVHSSRKRRRRRRNYCYSIHIKDWLTLYHSSR